MTTATAPSGIDLSRLLGFDFDMSLEQAADGVETGGNKESKDPYIIADLSDSYVRLTRSDYAASEGIGILPGALRVYEDNVVKVFMAYLEMAGLTGRGVNIVRENDVAYMAEMSFSDKGKEHMESVRADFINRFAATPHEDYDGLEERFA